MSEYRSKLGKVLDSELESFDRFMTARRIDGKMSESLSDREIRKVKTILERPLPDRFVQEKLLKQHIKH